MPSAAEIEAGRAFIELYVKDAAMRLGLRAAGQQVAAFAERVATLLNPASLIRGLGDGIANLGKRMALAAAPLAAGLAPFIKAASDAQETLNKFSAVFAEQEAAAGRFADRLASTVGRSAYQLKDSMSAFQAMFVGLGFASAEARGMSEQMQALAIDFGSFFNKSDEESAQRFLSALSGSSEVLDQFGINLKQAALEQELLAMGIDKTAAEASEQEKTLARVSLIMKAMTAQGAVGDAERTAGSFANTWKRAKGELLEAAVVVGNALIPAVTPLAQYLADLTEKAGAWAQRNQDLIRNAAGLAVKFLALGVALFALGKGIALAGTLLGVVFTLTRLWLVVTVILPALYKVAAALKLTTLAVVGLKLALTTLAPVMLKITLAGGALVVLLTAVGAAFANAQLQGISFGESVLDLTNKITGLSNAYVRLRATESQQKSRAAIVGDLEQAYRDSDVAGVTAGIGGLRRERDSVAQRLANETDEETARGLRLELQAIDLLIRRWEGKVHEVQVAADIGAAKKAFEDLLATAEQTARQIRDSLTERLTEAFERVGNAIQEQMPDLLRAKIEAIVDPAAREEARIRIEYQQRIDEAKAEGKPTALLEKARDQELANSRAGFAREAGGRRQDLEDQIARAEIDLIKDDRQRQRAVIERERLEAIRDAQPGEEIDRINKFYDTRLQAIAAPEQSGRQIAGTFSGYQAALMGSSQAPAERTAKNTERTAKALDQANKHLEDLKNNPGGIAFAP